MVWVVRTYKSNIMSGFYNGCMGIPEDEYFESKNIALEYRSKLNCYSELYQIEVPKSDIKMNETK